MRADVLLVATFTTLTMLLHPGVAAASFDAPELGEIAVRDIPGSDRRWQEARTVVDATPDTVRGWLLDFPHWPLVFRDVTEARVLSRSGDTTRLWMRSRILHSQIVLQIREGADVLDFHAREHGVATWGRVYVTPRDDGRSDVILQTTVQVSGLLSLIATREMVRSRSRDKLRADLDDLQRVAALARQAALAPPAAVDPNQ